MISPDALIVRSVHTGVWSTIFWRGALTAVGILVLLATLGSGAERSRVGRPRRLLAGGLFATASICFVSALRRTDVADVLVIIAAGPLFAAVLGRLFLKEPTPRRTWIASLAVLVGIGVIVSGSVGRGDLVGDLLALAGASCFAGYLTVSRGARPGDITPAIAIGGVGAALVGAVAGADLSIGGGDLLLLSVLGLAILPVSLTLITRATRHLSAAEVSLVALLETFLAPLWVWLAVGEVPAPEVVSGGAVVVAAVAAHTVPTLTDRPARAAG